MKTKYVIQLQDHVGILKNKKRFCVVKYFQNPHLAGLKTLDYQETSLDAVVQSTFRKCCRYLK